MSKIEKPNDWNKTRLGEVAVLRRGISYDSTTLKNSEEEGLPYINMKSFVKDGGYNDRGLKYFGGIYREKDTVKENDLLIANTDVTLDGDIVGVPALLPKELGTKEIVYSHHVTSLSISDELSKEFLYYLLCLPSYRSEMRRYARGTTVMMLDPHAIQKIKVSYPHDKSEQHKIANL